MEKADPKNRFLNDLWGQLYYGHPLWHNYKSIFSTSCLSFTLHVFILRALIYVLPNSHKKSRS